MKKTINTAATTAFALAFTGATGAPPAPTELPTGGQIISGAGAITQSAASMTVQQGTAKMITNWQTFNIGSQASVNFVQPSASSVALNRVLGADPSQIYGNLTANGQVFLLSPGGVIFGEGARVDVGGLMASTMNLSNADFLANNYRLSGGSEAVVNLGQLAAREGGFVALVGGTVENSGTITAPAGQVALAAGSAARLELGSSGLISVAVDSATAAKVENKGLISADGGRVFLTANRAAEALGTAVNQAGVVRANTLSNKNGEIWLDGGAGKTQIRGQILASGTQTGQRGGKIVATGAEVVLGSGSEVNASGAAGGGEVFVGGGWQGQDPSILEARVVTQESGSAIRASATEDGDGGTIAIWSSDRTRISGELSARGAGTGKGGAIETSSRKDLGVASAAKIDAGAESGPAGQWLLDPDSVVVAGSGGSIPYPDGTETVYADTISNALGGNTDVTIQTTTGSITVNAPISKIADSGAASPTLTFDALENITVNEDISSSSGSLNIKFGAAIGTRDAGSAIINAALSTNGGSVEFFKATTLAHAAPVSTKPSGGVSTNAGAVTFHKDVTLASPSYAVTLNSQGAQSGLTYTSAGGAIDFKRSILSGKPASLPWSPQALIIDSTSSTPHTSGVIILGSSSSDVIGKTTRNFLETNASAETYFDPNSETNEDGPLRSLTLAGPRVVDLKASAINLANTSGNVLVMSSIETPSPELRLNAAETQINLRGGAVAGLSTGHTDFVQDTFDIVALDNSIARALSVNSDRSIKVIGQSISGKPDGTGSEGSLNVSLNSARAVGADGGAVILNNATLVTYGGSVTIGSPDNRATGYAFDAGGVTDGVNIQNSLINTAGGAISVYGRTSANTGVSSAGVRIVDISGPSTSITAVSGSIVIDGTVQEQTSGDKAGVIIGEGGSALSMLQTTSGSLSILGDASSVVNPTAGASYTGVVIGGAALIETDDGDIDITGTGGGGDRGFVSENHGVRLSGVNTSIISTSGDITLTGTTGGKTSLTGGETSFGLFANAVNMYIGKDSSASASSSDIRLASDSMNFATATAGRLRVASSGELLIEPLTTATNIEFGAAGAVPAGALRLGSAWFDGASTAVFQPGFSGITVGSSNSTGRMTVAQATTLRDNAYLMMGTGSPSAIAIDAPLIVKRSGTNDRTLTLEANVGSITGTAAIDTDSLLIIGTGDVALTSSNLVNKLAANLDGQLDFVNAQTLQVSSVSGTKFQQSQVSNTGVATTNDNVNIRLTSGDLNLNQSISVGTATVGLTATAGRVTQSGASDSVTPIISAANLYVSSANTSRLNNQNIITNLAANISAGGLEFRDANTLNIGLIPVTSRTANTDGTVTLITTNRDGIVAQSTATSVAGDTAGQVLLTVNVGNLTQETVGLIAGGAIKVTELGVDMVTGAATLGNIGNEIGTFAAIARGSSQHVTLNESNGFMVGSVGILHGISTATDGNIALATNSGDITVTRSVSAGGAGTIDVRAGGAIAVNPASGQVARFESATDGTIQLIAGGAITTSTANSSGSDIPEISTSGSVVLRAGTSIGSDANRIEMFGNSVIAATAGGDIWLRRLGSGGFTVGSVGALAFNGVTTFTSTPNTLNGLTTAANNGNIALTRNAGSITVSQNIAAHGSGNVDIRAEGTDSDIVIGSTIQSGSGTIQLIANRDISASSATGNTAELLTTLNGRALLRAGNSIGAHGNAIDSSGDTSVAAALGEGTGRTGHIVLNHIAGDLTVAEVSAVNVNSTLDGTAHNVGGLISANRNITVTTQGTSNLNLAAALNAGTGLIVLNSADGISQTAGGFTASAARIDATGDAVITQAGNRVNVLSSRARNLEYLDSGVLQIGSTGIADTVGLQSNVSATNSVWIRAQGQQNPADPGATALTIPAGFQVTGNGSVPNAVVLVADGAFVNQAGANAISTPNSRWLVYDINPDLVYRLDNLPFVWRRVDTTYERFLPSAITRIGNVYITSASPVRPNEYLPQKLSELKPLPTDPGFAHALAYAPKPYGAQPQFLVTAFGKPPVSLSGSPIFPVEGALSLVVRPGSYFESALAGQIAGERIKAASMADGSALPGWLKIDPVSQRISGVMPKEGGDFPITLQLEGANGAAGRVIELVLGAGT